MSIKERTKLKASRKTTVLSVTLLMLLLKIFFFPNITLALTNMPISVSNVGFGAIGNNIYVVGGYTDRLEVSRQMYEYNTITDKWAKKSNMPTSRYDHTVASVGNHLYVIGGHNQKIKFSVNEVYDSATDSWSTKAPLPEALEDMESAVIGNKIYIFGGSSNKGLSNRLYVYDTNLDVWTRLKDMPFSSNAMGVTVYKDDIHIFGGFKQLHSHMVYHTKTDSWEEKNGLPTGRSHLVAFTYGNKIYTIGGTAGRTLNDPSLNVIETYHLDENKWTTEKNLNIPRSRFAIGLINDKAYIISGWSSWFTSSVELIDFNPSKPLPVPIPTISKPKPVAPIPTTEKVVSKKTNLSLTPPKWDGLEVRKGQIGRVTINKKINLWKSEKNKIIRERTLHPKEIYRVYGYREAYGGQYNVGGGYWVTNMTGHIKYETPSNKKSQEIKEYYFAK